MRIALAVIGIVSTIAGATAMHPGAGLVALGMWAWTIACNWPTECAKDSVQTSEGVSRGRGSETSTHQSHKLEN